MSKVETLLALFALISLAAYLVGGAPERFLGVVFLVWIPLDRIEHRLFGSPTYLRVDPFHLATDTAVFVLLVWLALRANRIWPLWAAAAQVMTFFGHIVALLEQGGLNHAYWAMTQVPPYIQLTALVCGAAFHERRFRRIGHYRSWRLS